MTHNKGGDDPSDRAGKTGSSVPGVSPLLSEDARKAREAVWRRYLARLEENGTPLERASAADLRACAAEHKAGPRPKEHCARVLGMAIDAVDALQSSGELPSGWNAAREARASMESMPSNDPTRFPDPGTVSLLADFLSGGGAEGEGRARVRDRAIAALCLGAGAPPAAVSLATVSCLKRAARDGVAELRSHRPTPKRPSSWEAQVLPFCVPAIRAWLDMCPTADGLSPAFPGRDGSGLSRSRVFRSVRSLLDELGWPPTRACPQSLRNAYFAALVDGGRSDASICMSMGWSASDGEQLRRMRLALAASRRCHNL